MYSKTRRRERDRKVEAVERVKYPDNFQVWDAEGIVKEGSLERLVRIVDGFRQFGRAEKEKLEILLEKACKLGQADLARFLLTKGLNPNWKDRSHGRTLLHLAALANSIETVRALLENGADKTIQSTNGQRPEESASMVGNHRCAQVIANFVSPWEMAFERKKRIEEDEKESTKCGSSEPEAIQLLQSVLQQKMNVYGENHVGLVTTLERLAAAFEQAGEIEQAFKVQCQAVDILSRHLEQREDHGSTAQPWLTHFKHAQLACKLWKWEKAEQSLHAALDILESNQNTTKNKFILDKSIRFDSKKTEFSVIAPHRRRILEKLAAVLEAQSKYAEESRIYHEIISLVQEETGDSDHPLLAFPLLALGRAESQLGRVQLAHDALSYALAVTDKHLGPTHLDVALCLDNLGMLYLDGQQFPQAEAIFRRALAIREDLLHPIHDRLKLQLCENNISLSIILRGKYSKRNQKKLAKQVSS